MGADCQSFLRALPEKISRKRNESYANVITWLRIQLSFAILRTVHKCIRGSKKPFKPRQASEDFALASYTAGLSFY